jgi:site-specific recombinase XerD
MARRPRSSQLENRTSRLKLPVQKKPHAFTAIAPGIALGYRRGKDRNAWVVRVADGKGGNWVKNLPGIPDDHENADGEHVLSFWQAQDAARKLARGSVETGRPITVAEALDAYERDLAARGGLVGNVTRVRCHLTPSLATKPVVMLTSRELQHWRDGLGMKAGSVNRTCHVVKAALNLAAKHDVRITNSNAWKIGLALLRDAHRARNVILTDAQVRALIETAYVTDPAFGLLVEVAATTGARPSQLARLDVSDLQADRDDPRLLMPSSRKGHAGKRIERRPVPLPAGLALRLRQAAHGRDASAPLVLRADGKAWGATDHRRPFERAAARIGLKPDVTFYSLRHSSIVRQLLAGAPIRVVAAAHDTSTAMIERTYSVHISDHADGLLRAGLLDVAIPAAGNVVALPGRRS